VVAYEVLWLTGVDRRATHFQLLSLQLANQGLDGRSVTALSEGVLAKLEQARIARLATLDTQGRPHIVPVCFVYDGSVLYTAVDRKPKRVAPERLAWLQHITAAPQVALLIDVL